MTWIQYLQKIADALEAPMPDIIPIPTAVLAKMLPERHDRTLGGRFSI